MKRATVSVALCAMLGGGCAGGASRYSSDTNLLYRNPSLTGGTFSERTILLLPPMRGERLDTVGYLAPRHQAQWFRKQRPDLGLTFIEQLRDTMRSAGAVGQVDSLCRRLARNDILAVQDMRDVWERINADFLLSSRLAYGASIRNLDNKVRKKVRIEVEMWDRRRREVVWRMSVTATTEDPDMRDEAVLWSALRDAYERLPGYRPAESEDEW